MAKKPVETKTAPKRVLSVDWAPFAQKLADVFEKFEEGQHVLLQVKHSNHYIQFAAQGSFGIRAETTSNAYLPKAKRLQPAQMASLIKAGWHAPTKRPSQSTPEGDPDGSPNFFIDFPASGSRKALAELAVRTLAEILCVPHPGFLEYGAFDEDRNEIMLPELGLRHLKAALGPKLPKLLLKSVAEFSGNPDLGYDEDGDIALRYESIVTFIRPVGEPARVQFFSRLVEDVKKTPKMLARLNEINAESSRFHLAFIEDAILAITDIPAEPLIGAHLKFALEHFFLAADSVGKMLNTEFGRKGSISALGQPMVLH